MTKILSILFLVCLFSIHQSRASKEVRTISQIAYAKLSTVYICNNGKTVVYHSRKNCGALTRCSHEVVQTTTALAKGSGKRACLKC